ncbi:isoprenyl transferase [Streptomyces hirsutus]
MAVRGFLGRQRREYKTPVPHPSGARPPKFPSELVPKHVAIVMDGNGRWAKERGLPRTEGHKVGAERVLDVLQGGIEMGVGAISLYAFSTENWKRSPDEVRFLMNFNRDFISKSRDELDELGVRVRWVGRMPKLWKSVAKELQVAQEQTKDNDRLTLYFCMNYGGRAEIADAAQALAEDVKAGRLDPAKVNEKTLQNYMYYPDMPDVDLFLRPSGEQRTSNYLLWQSAYAEMVFQDVLWPDFDRRDLWRACLEFASRDRPLRRRDPERGTARHGGQAGTVRERA